MAAGDVNQAFGATGDLTITLASLATDASKLTGRESTSLSFTSTKPLDCLLQGKVTTGTSPTDAKTIEVLVVGSADGTNWPDVFDGTDSAETITSALIKGVICKVAASMPTNNTSDRSYPFGPISVAALFGGVLPSSIAVFVTHDTAVNLNATGSNHKITYQNIYETVAQ